MAIEKGTKVVVIGGGPTAQKGDYHTFKHNTVVTATGRVYDFNPEWELFADSDGNTSWLRASHYELSKELEVAKAEAKQEAVDPDLPTKALYAVIKKSGTISYSGSDRETAREVKFALGGKKKGVRIFQYAATKEIR
jgi:hypothetical protein